MDTCRLAPDLEISRLVTGLWQIADMERGGRTLDLDATAAALAPYAEAGLSTFDMADHYGSAEEIAGRFLAAGDGEGVRILTKWVPKPGPVTREQVRAAVERSLSRLRSPRIDLLQFHAWSYADPGYLDCLLYLRELQGEGLILHLGLTNFDTAHLRVVLESGIEVVSNQVCFSLLDRRPLAGMTDLCEQRGIRLLAYGALAGGLLTERFLGQPDVPAENLETWSEKKYRRFVTAAGGWEVLQGLLATVHDIAQSHQVSMANVATRYVLDQPAVGAVLIGARLGEREHLRDNLRSLQLRLSDQDRAAIDSASRRLQPIPGGCGDEYRRPPFLTASGDLSDHFDGFPPPYPVDEGEGGRLRAFSGTRWEKLAAFSRAVRQGNRILVSGTTATHRDRAIGGDDPAAQTHFIIDKIEGALQSLGGRLEDVVRTRVYLRELEDWEAVARAHGERFAGIEPANTLVAAGLIGAEHRVEIEAEALVPDRPTPQEERE